MSDKEELFRDEEEEVGVKEISLGIIFPPRAVTRIMADLVPLGPVTLTRPVGKVFIVVLPEKSRVITFIIRISEQWALFLQA